MSRRARRQNEVSVTLFPFLAVLICTMGSLIVLLVVVVQQAGEVEPDEAPHDVATAELPPDVERQQTLEQQRADLEWQADMLAKSREETLRRVKAQQVELSRAEDQTRRIKERLDQLYAQSEQLEQGHTREDLSSDQLQIELAELQSQIDSATLDLVKAQESAADKKRKFALVPYEGRNGTQRRPIYIECRGDRVILQPEAIELTADDFRPPLGPANPLAAAIRSIREYYVSNGVVRASTEPYPLIVVRPDGASAFAACRSALQGWDDEFGYELLPDDFDLSYPNVDPGLKEVVARTIEESRWKRQQSVINQPRELVLSVDSRHGGFQRQGVAASGGGSPAGRGEFADGPHAATGSAGGQGERNSAFESGSSVATGNPVGGNVIGGDSMGGSNTAVSRPRGNVFDGPGGANPTGVFDSSGSSVVGQTGPYAYQDVAGQDAAGQYAAGHSAEQYAEQTLAQHDVGHPSPPEGSQPAYGGNQGGGSFDELMDSQSLGSTSGGATTGGSPSSGSATTATNQASSDDTSTSMAAGMPSMRSIAERQGSNWALPGAAAGSIAINRPVAVRCDAVALELLPEPGSSNSLAAIPWSRGAATAVQEMVAAIWARIDNWGTAGSGAYWKPVIELIVAPEAETQYHVVAQLLEDSGMIVTRR